MRPRDSSEDMVAIDPAAIAVLSRRVTQASGDLADAARRLRTALTDVGLPGADAAVLDATSGWLRDQVAGLDRRRAIAEAASSETVWTASPTTIVYVDPWPLERYQTREDVIQAARVDAVRLKASLRDGRVDMDVVTDIGCNQGDPAFAVAFAEAMGPDGLTDVAFALDGQRRTVDRDAAWHASSYEAAVREQQGNASFLLASLGAVFGTATRGSSVDQLPPDFAHELVKGLPATAFGLSELLRFGVYDPAFLTLVGDSIVSYDEQNNYYPAFWAHRESPDGDTPWTEPGDRPYYDPVVGLLTALSNNPVAAQAMLGDPATLRFLSNRKGFADDGASFGAALEAATTTFRDGRSTNSPGYRSAAIASRAITDLAGSDAHIPNGLRAPLGRILAAYIADVDAAAISGGTTDVGVRSIGYSGLPAFSDYGALLSREHLRTVMLRAFGDSSAFQTVSAAALTFAQQYFEATATSVARDGLELSDFNAAAAHSAALLGLLTDTGNIAQIDTARGNDANRQSWLDLGRSSLDLVDVPGGKLVGWAVDQVKDRFFDDLTPETASLAEDHANSAADHARTMVLNMAAAAMARHGLFGGPSAPTSPLAYHPSGPASGNDEDWRFAHPDGTLFTSADITSTRYQAYQDWLYGPTSGFSGVQTTVEADFSALQQQYGAR